MKTTEPIPPFKWRIVNGQVVLFPCSVKEMDEQDKKLAKVLECLKAKYGNDTAQ